MVLWQGNSLLIVKKLGMVIDFKAIDCLGILEKKGI